jgi:NUMOD3 motif
VSVAGGNPTDPILARGQLMHIYHEHHFVPRHAGGTDDPSNIVRVTIPEHVSFHYERWVVTGDYYDWLAWKVLVGQIRNSEATRLAQAESGRRNRGRKHSAESRAKMSAYRKGRKRKPLTDEHREKIRRSLQGSKHTDETRKKMSATKTGRKLSEDHRAKIKAGRSRRRSESPTVEVQSLDRS